MASSVRGRGLLLGLVLSSRCAADIVSAAHEKGLLVCPAGPDVVRFVPPLTVTNEEIEQSVVIVEQIMHDLQKETRS